ncbi:glycosyltransferase family 87 protein [Candidatus Chloroploca sp. Khr17]|uniref:glycosyltransferase family 87 protein n=1 Tax=Candidatus Chloroploca sp. Khr17 TaxID=2496869 RepID=UPI00101BA1E9|nr:glycosyltransferase family 87 protein [Candidatus Chloroploca sp. Khr17]
MKKLYSSQWYTTSIAILFASIIFILVHQIPQPSPAFYRFYRGIHDVEQGSIGAYVWSQPDFMLNRPLEWATRQVLITQEMSAGPTADMMRLLQVSTRDITFDFMIQGGLPLRTYSYLLPSNSSSLDINFNILPIDHDFPNDQRSLGLILIGTDIKPMTTSHIPSLSVLSFFTIPFALFLVCLHWRGRYWPAPLLFAILLVIAFFYAQDRYLVLPSTIALNCGLLTIALFSYLCRRLLQLATARDWICYTLLFALATVIVPWIYIATGLTLNLSRQWLGQSIFIGTLLGLPVLSCIIYLWFAPNRTVQLALVGLSLIAVLTWGLLNLNLALSRVALDFPAYYNGAQRVLLGQPLYELERLRNETFSVTYKYHPLFLIFIFPIAFTSLDTAITLWRSLGIALIIASTIIVVINQPRTYWWPLALPALIVATNLAPVWETLRFGQIDALLLFGIVAASATFYRSPWLSATIWAILGLVKIYPLFLLLDVFLQRTWRWLFSVGLMLLLGIGLSLLLAPVNELTFWQDVVPLLGERNGRLANQSIYGLIVRLLDPNLIFEAGAMPNNAIANLLFLALVLPIFGLTLWRLYVYPMPLWDSMSLLVCTNLLIMPVSWDHYQTILVVPLIVALARLLKNPNMHGFLFVAAYAMLTFGTTKNLWLSVVEPNSFWISFAAYRTLGLFLLWLWWLRYQQPDASRLPSRLGHQVHVCGGDPA